MSIHWRIGMAPHCGGACNKVFPAEFGRRMKLIRGRPKDVAFSLRTASPVTDKVAPGRKRAAPSPERR